MNRVTKTINELIPIMEQHFEAGQPFKLFPKGTSMLPTLKQGIDSVLLIRSENIKKYDIVLYKRKSGQIVLHRVVGKNKAGYIICGDNQMMFEYGIDANQILAKALGYYKDFTYISADSREFVKNARKISSKRNIKHILKLFGKIRV